jgi:branched-chain amino acid transport system ATP-binding protein
MSVLENVIVGALGSARGRAADLDARALELLARVGLAGKERAPVDALSYGDQRRLEIARALAAKPALLLLDEPFAGLGSGEIEDLSTLIRQVHAADGLTVVLIEHKLREFMRLVDRVIALDFGEIIAQGSPEDIVLHPAVIEAYIGRDDAGAAEASHAA